MTREIPVQIVLDIPKEKPKVIHAGITINGEAPDQAWTMGIPPKVQRLLELAQDLPCYTHDGGTGSTVKS